MDRSKSNTFFKRVESWHFQNLNQAKPNSNNITQCPILWDSFMIFWTPPLGLSHFSGSVLCSTHSLSPRLQLVPLHCYYCSWWSSHVTGISKTLGSFAASELHFTNIFLQALFTVLSFKFFAWPLQSWAFNCYWDCTFSSGFSWLLAVPCLSCSPWPLHCLQNQYHWGNAYILPSLVASTRWNFGHFWNTASLCSQETLLRRFHLSAAGLFFITTNFSVLAD